MGRARVLLFIQRSIGALCLLLAAPACSGDGGVEDGLARTESELAGATAAGKVPTGMPSRLLVGLFEDTGRTWMSDSGVPWDVRYRYLVKRWVDNWGYSAHDGSFARSFFDDSKRRGYLPAVQYYQMNDEPGGGEGAFWSKTQNASTMRAYFGDFKILMQRVKDFGDPVLVLIEADGTAFLQQQTGANPSARAAVAATGMSELASLPDTVAGWGLAFLQIRKAVGANNAVLGLHVSAWATSKDIAHAQSNVPLGPEVDAAYAFLAPFGLTENVTGTTYDVLVGDPLDRDADYYALARGENRVWDPGSGASINSRSFNRYAEWLRLWNQKAGRRWVLWQIPLGNSNHRNVHNDGSARAGYKDNRPEYFFGDGSDAHRVKFADAGVMALLFGAGAGGQSSYQNDIYHDGQPFMKTHAGRFYASGGLAIDSGDDTAPPTEPPPSEPPPATGCHESVIEAEAMSPETGGATRDGWNLWSNGALTARHGFAAGPTEITVIARGSSADGVWPHLVLKLDGQRVGDATVSSTGYRAHTFQTTMDQSGERVLEIEFDNDAVIGGEDRNLLVDKALVRQGCASGVLRELWSGIGGISVSLVPIAKSPSFSELLSAFEAPTNVADNYGQRLSAVLVAPLSGSYRFWVAGDDHAELWLSTNAGAEGKRRIAYHTGYTASRQWNKYASQRSAGIELVAGTRYYIEALSKEAGGGDNLAVGWARPGQSTSSPSEVIPGSVLAPR